MTVATILTLGPLSKSGLPGKVQVSTQIAPARVVACKSSHSKNYNDVSLTDILAID